MNLDGEESLRFFASLRMTNECYLKISIFCSLTEKIRMG
jgi:hypothetical protein